jgi:hypothetical protein
MKIGSEPILFFSVGISPKLKKLSKEQKESLDKSGEFSTKNFLNK